MFQNRGKGKGEVLKVLKRVRDLDCIYISEKPKRHLHSPKKRKTGDLEVICFRGVVCKKKNKKIPQTIKTIQS